MFLASTEGSFIPVAIRIKVGALTFSAVVYKFSNIHISGSPEENAESISLTLVELTNVVVAVRKFILSFAVLFAS